MRISKTLAALTAIAACGTSVAAWADNPVGFYIGAGAGESEIRSDDSSYGLPGYYNDYQTAWQGLLGIRPIKLLGLEAEYIDFGQPSYRLLQQLLRLLQRLRERFASHRPRAVRGGLLADTHTVCRRVRQGRRRAAVDESHGLCSAALLWPADLARILCPPPATK